VYGGNVTVELGSETPFPAAASPTGRSATIFERYLGSAPYASLAYAAVVGLATLLPARMLTALLLVNPISALAGRESADRSASARVLRAGVTVAGSRPGRAISRPDVVIIDEPRALCGGWELSRTPAFPEDYDEQDVLRLASALSTAAGSPWGVTLPVVRVLSAVGETFDGRAASAEIGVERWLLEPGGPEIAAGIPHEADEHVAGPLPPARRASGRCRARARRPR
jgi:hypothetical protein